LAFSCQHFSFYGGRLEGYQFTRVAVLSRYIISEAPKVTRIIILGITCYSSLHLIGRLVKFNYVAMQICMDYICVLVAK
jgi:hypothetical protein